MNMGETIRGALATHGRLSVPLDTLSDDDDLYENGLSSHECVNVMLALENAFGEEFPDSLLRRSTFQSVSSLRAALTSMGIASNEVTAD
jgi:acyl carrier protein